MNSQAYCSPQAEQNRLASLALADTSNFFYRPRLGKAMQQVLIEAGRAASHSLNLLITGPSGSGKDYLAKLIQANSAQAKQAFVRISCSTLPEDLLEAEVFGVSQGAFSGALARPGLVELAQGGYLLLDEIADLPLNLQPKLLRFLETKEFSRLGEQKIRQAQVRLVAASNEDLAQKIAEGSFRADLYYRLAQTELTLPPLTERAEELEDLINTFILQANQELATQVTGFTAQVLQEALNYSWPGNLRELQNKVRLAVLHQQTGELNLLV